LCETDPLWNQAILKGIDRVRLIYDPSNSVNHPIGGQYAAWYQLGLENRDLVVTINLDKNKEAILQFKIKLEALMDVRILQCQTAAAGRLADGEKKLMEAFDRSDMTLRIDWGFIQDPRFLALPLEDRVSLTEGLYGTNGQSHQLVNQYVDPPRLFSSLQIWPFKKLLFVLFCFFLFFFVVSFYSLFTTPRLVLLALKPECKDILSSKITSIVVCADPMNSIHDTLFTTAEHAAHYRVTHSGMELALTVNLSKAKETPYFLAEKLDGLFSLSPHKPTPVPQSTSYDNNSFQPTDTSFPPSTHRASYDEGPGSWDPDVIIATNEGGGRVVFSSSPSSKGSQKGGKCAGCAGTMASKHKVRSLLPLLFLSLSLNQSFVLRLLARRDASSLFVKAARQHLKRASAESVPHVEQLLGGRKYRGSVSVRKVKTGGAPARV